MPPSVSIPRPAAYTSKRPLCMFLEPGEKGNARCRILSTWRMFLLLRDKHGVEKRMSTPLKVCNRHRATITVDKVLDRRTGLQVTSQMMQKCGFRPKKNETRLYYDRVDCRIEEID